MMKYINIHTHTRSPENSSMEIVNISIEDIEIAQMHPAKYFSLGIHPWFVEKSWQENLKVIENCRLANIKFIGEIGLDKNSKIPFDLQKTVFIEQLKIAEKKHLPVIIHCVRAFNEMFELRQIYKNQVWIFHQFCGNANIYKQFEKSNCYFSFGNNLYLNYKSRNTLDIVSPEKLFLETDDKNISILQIYNQAAYLKNMELLDLKKIIYQNFLKICK